MKNIILFLLLLIVLFSQYKQEAYADENFLWRDSDVLKSGLTQSQWVMFLGAEIMRLNPITNFSLPRQSLGERTETLYGPALGFARKWYIAGNLTTTIEPMLYYLQNDDTQAQVPSEEALATYKVSEFKERYQYFGARIAQSLGYTFEFDSFNLEPFVQVYVGQGFNRTKIHYHWDTQILADHQMFESTMNESVTHQGFSVGMQIIALNGYMSFFKVSKNTLTFKKRKTKNQESIAGVSTSSETSETLNDDIDKLSVTLGLGYIF